jgi:hypothetical protein
MRVFKAFLCGAAFATIAETAAVAGPDECREAVDQYNNALSELRDAVRAYTTCIADSRGHDDCSSEFSALQSAQDDFESAVSEYQSECG